MASNNNNNNSAALMAIIESQTSTIKQQQDVITQLMACISRLNADMAVMPTATPARKRKTAAVASVVPDDSAVPAKKRKTAPTKTKSSKSFIDTSSAASIPLPLPLPAPSVPSAFTTVPPPHATKPAASSVKKTITPAVSPIPHAQQKKMSDPMEAAISAAERVARASGESIDIAETEDERDDEEEDDE